MISTFQVQQISVNEIKSSSWLIQKAVSWAQIFRQKIIWGPSEKGYGGYTTSESDRLDEIQRAQGHTSEPACVFETAFEAFWFRHHSHNCIWPYDVSFDFEPTSETRSGEKPYASFNCWMGTPGGQWLACIDAKNEQKIGKCTANI